VAFEGESIETEFKRTQKGNPLKRAKGGDYSTLGAEGAYGPMASIRGGEGKRKGGVTREGERSKKIHDRGGVFLLLGQDRGPDGKKG